MVKVPSNGPLHLEWISRPASGSECQPANIGGVIVNDTTPSNLEKANAFRFSSHFYLLTTEQETHPVSDAR